MAYEAKALPFEKGSLKGISEKTIETHYEKLYKGYVTKLNEVMDKFAKTDKATANQAFSDWRGLKDGQTFAADGVILHELYFGNLGGNGDLAGTEIEKAISKQYDSFDHFKDVVTATGMSARGWAVVAKDPLSGGISIYQCDAHNQGGIWGATPILVLDVYEHAYFMDFGSDRKSYIAAFWENINWAEVNKRYLKTSQ